jgi:hypothetical protein
METACSSETFVYNHKAIHNQHFKKCDNLCYLYVKQFRRGLVYTLFLRGLNKFSSSCEIISYYIFRIIETMKLKAEVWKLNL